MTDDVRPGEPPTGVRAPGGGGRFDLRLVLLPLLSLGFLGGVLWRGGPVPDPSLLEPIRALRIETPTVSRQAVLTSGDTLAGLVQRLGVSAQEATIWLGEAQRHLNLRALPVGLLAEGVLDLEGNLLRLRLTPDWRSDVVLERQGGSVTGRREARPIERQLTVVRGTIRSSLFEAVDAAGETDDLALAMADIFGWDIDFHREVQPGDTFSVLCERVRADGRIVAYGPIVAATYVNQGRVYTACRFAAAGAPPGYYDAQGRALRKLFLRAPLKLTRVTSRFSASRKHPVLGKRLPHWGVDYGAPTGTPVSVTADGTVGFVGYSGGRGNTVEVRHAGGYTTAYLHLSRFAAGLRPGARVEQGQVIGFVGSTGLSTGPHLDYRITRQGRPLNPLAMGRDPAPPLPEVELARFSAWRAQVEPLLEVPGSLSGAGVVALRAAAPVPLGG